MTFHVNILRVGCCRAVSLLACAGRILTFGWIRRSQVVFSCEHFCASAAAGLYQKGSGPGSRTIEISTGGCCFLALKTLLCEVCSLRGWGVRSPSKRLQNAFRTPPKCLRNAFKTLPKRLQNAFRNAFNVPSKRIQNAFKTPSKAPANAFQSVFKTPSKRLQNAFKTPSKRIQNSSKMLPKRFQNASKTSSERFQNASKTF